MNTGNPEFAFVPFAQQSTSRKVHRIALSIAAPEKPAILETCCPHCQQPFRSAAITLKPRVWGDVERLELLVPGVPQIVCGGGGPFEYIEDNIMQQIKVPIIAIDDYLNLGRRKHLHRVEDLLSPEDVLKVTDMAHNRHVPKDCIFPHLEFVPDIEISDLWEIRFSKAAETVYRRFSQTNCLPYIKGLDIYMGYYGKVPAIVRVGQTSGDEVYQILDSARTDLPDWHLLMLKDGLQPDPSILADALSTNPQLLVTVTGINPHF